MVGLLPVVKSIIYANRECRGKCACTKESLIADTSKQSRGVSELASLISWLALCVISMTHVSLLCGDSLVHARSAHTHASAWVA